MTWTEFMDMHSGGGTKESPFEYIYIEAPEAEARVIFYNRFGHNPDRVSCTCCGEDYSIEESESLKRLTGYRRRCRSLETPRDGRGYKHPDDPWFKDHYWLEPEEHEEAERRGWSLSPTYGPVGPDGRSLAYGDGSGGYQTLDEYLKNPDVLVIRADEIKPQERVGDVPEQGFVWRD